MTETTQEERLGWRDVAERRRDQADRNFVTLTAVDLLKFVDDAGRLAAIERLLNAMISEYEFFGDESVRARDTVRELRAFIDAPDAGGEG